MNPGFDPRLLSRVEDAGLNASAPPQQRWLDGWLVRFSPGKAKRARCINAVAVGCLPLDRKLALCDDLFRTVDLPLVVRITPFSCPPDLDAQLASRGMRFLDDTRVMVCGALDALASRPLPAGCRIERPGHGQFAQIVGQLRGSPLAQRLAHAQRLEQSPVPFHGFALKDDAGAVLSCGQLALEADLVGLYDVFTAPAARGRGLARALCLHMLIAAREGGATVAYLQVDGDNEAARRVYRHLGFADAYRYHYRTAEPGPV